MQHAALGWHGAGWALLTAALWGGTAVAIRFSVDAFPPVLLAGVRFLIASVFMWFWCRWEGCSLEVRPGQWRPILWSGVLLFFQIATFNVGVQWSNSTHGSLLINTYTFWVVAFELLISRTMRLSLSAMAGLALASLGCVLVVSFDGPQSRAAASVTDPVTLAGDAMLVLSGFVLGAKTIYTKHALKFVETSKLVFWHDVVGTVLFLAYGVSLESVNLVGIPAGAWWGLLYQSVVVAGFCFAVSTHLLRKYSASQVSMFSFSTPLFGTALGVSLRGDPLTVTLLLASALVALGIWLVNRK